MITPVILCGGSGTRLWPASRKDYPKQFTDLMGGETLFQAAVRRFAHPDFTPPLVVSNSDFRFLVAEQLTALGQSGWEILLEPEARDTAPAILCAALYLEAKGQGSTTMVVAPSDHLIRDPEAFHSALRAAVPASQAGQLISLGIAPDRPETGYGYLELDVAPDFTAPETLPVRRFVEKPDAAAATEMLATGRYLWNGGIFVFGVDTLIAAFEAVAPELVAPCRQAVADAKADLDFIRLDSDGFSGARKVSIDYAVMEKAEAVSTVPVSCGWSDLGAWDAVWREMDQDADGVARSGSITDLSCSDTLLWSEAGGGPHVLAIGLEHTVVVAMRDAILVAKMDALQDVKAAVSAMRSDGVAQADSFPRSYRPWGWYQTLALDSRFQVKQIMVPPGKKLSLQSHVHRSEHWIVVAGTAKVTVNEDVQLVTENQSVYIPLGAVHRMENPGKVDLHLIEVQTGAYLGEDDIIRYEDLYNRV